MEYNHKPLINHLEFLVGKIMDGVASESDMEIQIVVQGKKYDLPLNADTYTALVDMLEVEIKNEEGLS